MRALPSMGVCDRVKLQYFGHLMRRVDSLEKILMLGGIGGRRRRGRQRMRWLIGSPDTPEPLDPTLCAHAPDRAITTCCPLSWTESWKLPGPALQPATFHHSELPQDLKLLCHPCSGVCLVQKLLARKLFPQCARGRSRVIMYWTVEWG